MMRRGTGATPLMTPSMDRPHLVILGAGASRAALPHGDRHGRVVPLMADLVNVLDLGPLLKQYGVDTRVSDFELIYSSLTDGGQHPALLAELERRTRDYFLALELPDSPTLYDHLVLSLRPKDFIATFNWDPLLWQALTRIAQRLGPDVLPQPLFLHGNVAIAQCLGHQPPTQGDIGQECQKCGQPLVPSRLLFPVTHKEYANDAAIGLYWHAVKLALAGAYFLTVFGYRAPASDAEALGLMRRAWGDPHERRFEQVEVIDIRPSYELAVDWERFIHTAHHHIMPSFYRSSLSNYPRRSCEYLFQTTMMLKPQPHRQFPRGSGWGELLNHVQPLIEQERTHKSD